MGEIDRSNPHQEEQQPSYTPASFEKRTAAWMGIAYMLMFLFIITFSLFRSDRSLAGTFPLFLTPVSVAALVLTAYRLRKGTAPGGKAVAVVVMVLCALIAAASLWLGVPVLAAALAG